MTPPVAARRGTSGSHSGRLHPAVVPTAVAIAVVLFARVAWDVPSGVLVQGAIIGGLTALLALGLALVWRANRIINFAAGDLGAMPATLGVLFTVSTVGLSWWAGLAIGLVAAIALGIAVEVVIVRRFTRSPRLVLSVATIGLAQVLAAGALLLPRWFTLASSAPPAPFDLDVTIAPITFGGADVVAVVVIPVVLAALALFLTRSDLGIAVRAGAESADRAATLGIPIRRLNTVVWVLATVLAFLAVYLRAGVVGLPLGEVLGPTILLRALAAAVIGRMERLPLIALAAVLLGVVEQAVSWHWQEPDYVDPVLFVVVVVALLVTRVRSGRGAEASTWQAAREVRPVPSELARLPEVRAVRWGGGIAVVGGLLAAPLVLTPSTTNLASAIVIFAIIGMSLVVLTGWAGQVSLGQMAFAGIGAAVAGAVTARLHWDLSVGLLLGALAGAAVAALIGLPALRRRGLTLAVISLAFALMTSAFLLNRGFFGDGASFFDWLPPDRIERTPLFGEIGLHGETRFYYLSIVGLALAYAVVRGLRRTRTGRTLVAIRDNEPAAEAAGVHAHRTTLFAFACSGFLAAFAGALFVHQQSGLTAGPYHPEQSLEVFTMAVIGGLGSAPGALLGALYVRGADYYLVAEWQILATGAGLLIVLMLLPGGLGGAIADARDRFLRRVAARHGLAAPGGDPGEPDPALAPDSPAPDSGAPIAPADAGPAMLRVRGLRVAYEGVPILHGLDLDVAPGEIVALLGTNGAGKSTVLRAIAGLAPVSGGTVVVDGADVTRASADARAALGIASAPGGVGIFPSLTVAEHLRLAGWTRRDDPAALRQAIDAASGRFPELDDRSGTRAGELSGGQQQMLNLAMALVARPRLLLLDELSLGLAPVVVARLLPVVRDLAAEGTTVLLVEQSVSLALEVAARAYFLEKGTVRFAGPTRELLDRPELVRAVFLARPDDATRRPATGPAVSPAPGDAARVRLEVRGITKHFGGVQALDDVSLDARDGEILGVLGPNGAGKTTLFDVVSGFLEPEHGSVRLVDGDRSITLGRLRPASRAQAGLGRTFQDARLFPALTVAEAVAVACEDLVPVRDPIAAALHLPAVTRSERTVEERVDALLDRFGLRARHDSFVRELSTGTRRVLDLACAVAANPHVLLLDEPSAGLARAEAEELVPVLRGIRDDLGTTLVVIEHDLAMLGAVSDRVVALDVGRVIATGPPDEVLHDPAVVAAYLGTAEQHAP